MSAPVSPEHSASSSRLAPSSGASSRKASDADSGDAALTAEEQAEADAEVRELMAQVKQSMAESAPEGEEEQEEVKVSDHLNMAGLRVNEKDEASASNSATSSLAASPAIAPASGDSSAAQHAAMQSLPPVELQDGGAAVQAEAAAPGKKGFADVRIAIVGNVDSGKSTLIGVLTGGQLDDGRGKARSRVFIHSHELSSGRTSAISQHIMGFDADSKPVHQTAAASAQAAAKSKSWAQVMAHSKSIITFIDLAGHEKYLKTTIAGLTGSHPDYACVIINSLQGISKMTKEHLGVVLALEIPLICVVTKVDMAPTTVLEQTKKQLFRILKSSAANKMPIQMRSEKDIETVITNSENSNKICPVFFISAVNGTHVDLLTSYLSRLRPHLEWLQTYAHNLLPTRSADGTLVAHPDPVEFAIDETFSVSGVGIVISGTLHSGVLRSNAAMLLGPFSDGSFMPVLVRSLHYKRVAVEEVEEGQSCAVAIRATRRKDTLKRTQIRRGMVLVSTELQPRATRYFDAEVLILHHATSIKLQYQAVLHCGMIRQTAQIVRIMGAAASAAEAQQKQAAQASSVAAAGSPPASAVPCLRTGDKSLCRFRFLQRPEYVHNGSAFVFREGSTKGVGKVVRTEFSAQEEAAMDAEEAARRRVPGKSQFSAAHKAEMEDAAQADKQASAAATASAASASASSSSAASAASSGGYKKSYAEHKQAAAEKKSASAHKAAPESSAAGGKPKWVKADKTHK